MAQGKVLDKDGVKSVIQVILDKREIRPGQIWRGVSSTAIVKETRWFDDDLWVYYSYPDDASGKVLDKEAFSFQCRYCLDPTSPNISPKLAAYIATLDVIPGPTSSKEGTE